MNPYIAFGLIAAVTYIGAKASAKKSVGGAGVETPITNRTPRKYDTVLIPKIGPGGIGAVSSSGFSGDVASGFSGSTGGSGSGRIGGGFGGALK